MTRWLSVSLPGPASGTMHGGRSRPLSDFVVEQAQRDPQMFVALAESGELERSLAPGELRQQLEAQLAECADEDALGA
jgi:hypothetical protein